MSSTCTNVCLSCSSKCDAVCCVAASLCPFALTRDSILFLVLYLLRFYLSLRDVGDSNESTAAAVTVLLVDRQDDPRYPCVQKLSPLFGGIDWSVFQAPLQTYGLLRAEGSIAAWLLMCSCCRSCDARSLTYLLYESQGCR